MFIIEEVKEEAQIPVLITSVRAAVEGFELIGNEEKCINGRSSYYSIIKTQNGKIIYTSDKCTNYRNCHKTALKIHNNLKQSTLKVLQR